MEPTSLREQLLAAHPDIDQALLQSVSGAEKLATAKAVLAAGNNSFPHWTPERWLAVSTFIMACLATSITWIWIAGGQWQEMKNSINALRTDVGDVKLAVSEIKTEQSSVRIELAATKAAFAPEPPKKRTPIFGPPYSTVR
jgi:hypothetical protein